MACLILKTLILKSMRLVGALLWRVSQLIGAWIAKKGLKENLGVNQLSLFQFASTYGAAIL